MIVDPMQSVPANHFGSLLRSVWRTVLYVSFLVLCVRFLAATIRQTYPELGPTLLLITGSAVLGAWLSRAALFAVICAVPLLNGLGYVGLNGIPSPPSLVFSALFVGISCRWLFYSAKELKEQKSSPPSQNDAEEVEGNGQPVIGVAMLLADLSITVILVSLVGQMVRHLGDVSFWTKFWSQPVFGYGDPLYFVSSAFLWMQGLFILRLLVSECDHRVPQGGAGRTNAPHPLLLPWLVTLSSSLSLLIFAIVQRQWDLPEKYAVFAYTSPFEDIHSFGAIAVTCLVFFLAAFRFISVRRAVGPALCVMALLALTILSWSRATWLAGVAVTALVTFLRVSWKWRILLVLVGGSLLIAANHAAKSSAWQNNSYLWRLGNLVRFESPTQKDPSRMNLYHKALGMIQERPLMGHGIGSFYLKSVNYAKTGDPYADIPNFAHNFLLQFAAELGVPATLLLAGLIALALIRGYRHSSQLLKIPRSDLTVFGLTAALAAYLITQMTANALNIYASNQFIFGFLMAALLSGAKREGESESD